eukprot:CAMPEP_0183502922 /NCGR_PEP_ID=MMETSP0371-20130417/4665_1 /TAXON_ID=268820 /ORGANISM="Peridinium aciculiferum, Strain PAER-2" /LENGTH=151 /DNA_ID=CAMNT_0025697827 /DNA_START=67 /DNA_END=522 /DNA_ORIENTATION=-
MSLSEVATVMPDGRGRMGATAKPSTVPCNSPPPVPVPMVGSMASAQAVHAKVLSRHALSLSQYLWATTFKSTRIRSSKCCYRAAEPSAASADWEHTSVKSALHAMQDVGNQHDQTLQDHELQVHTHDHQCQENRLQRVKCMAAPFPSESSS